jgi:hypothetical protein
MKDSAQNIDVDHHANDNNSSDNDLAIVLFHATAEKNLQSIAENGLRLRTYFTCDDDICDYYAETLREEGDACVILAVDLADLDPASLSPDFPGIEEPITTCLDIGEEDVAIQWEESSQQWRDSLVIVKTLRCESVIPAASIRVVDDAGEHHLLTEYVQRAAKHSRPPRNGV